MKYYTVRIIGGTNTNLLNEMVGEYFYLPDDMYYDWHHDDAPFKTTAYEDGFDIRFSIPDRCNEVQFADWAAEFTPQMFDDNGYDWWGCGDENHEIHTLNDKKVLIVSSANRV